MSDRAETIVEGWGSAEGETAARKGERRKGSNRSLRRRQKRGGNQIKGELCVCVSLDYAAPQGSLGGRGGGGGIIDGLIANPSPSTQVSCYWRPLIWCLFGI